MMEYSDFFLKNKCRKLFIRNFRIPCHIGVYDSDKKHTQTVIFNCDIWIPLSASTSQSDNIEDVLNYDLIVTTIQQIAQSMHFNLQETLVDTIADKLMTLPGVISLRLSSSKPEAYDNIDEAGIEIWRIRSSLTNSNHNE